jgi:hypothetical protein
MAYALTWIIWSLGVYAGSQPRYESYAGLFSLIGLVGPIGTALASRCAALKKDFKDRLFNLRRVRPVFALIAVVVPFIVIGLSITLKGSGSRNSNRSQ